MSIRLFSENGSSAHLEWYQKAASEVFTFNDLVGINTSGYVTKYTDGAAFPELGLIQRTIAATASDYASNTKVAVLVAGDEAEYLCDVAVGTAAQTDVGEYIDVDGAGSPHQNVDVTASGNNDFYVTQFISTALVVAKMTRKVAATAGSIAE